MLDLVVSLALAVAASQADTAAPDRLFDATDPALVADGLREAGYKAELKTNAQGEPFITSAANGSPFTIEFYGCEKARKCPSFQFFGYYKKDPLYTIQLANEWNTAKRFLKLRIDQDGDLALSMDVAAVGKMTQAQLADWIDWYQVMDAELNKFLTEKRGAAGKPAPAPRK